MGHKIVAFVFRFIDKYFNRLICLISVQEGAFLYKNNVNPYSGDLDHENPLIQSAGQFIPYLFVACDLLFVHFYCIAWQRS